MIGYVDADTALRMQMFGVRLTSTERTWYVSGQYRMTNSQQGRRYSGNIVPVHTSSSGARGLSTRCVKDFALHHALFVICRSTHSLSFVVDDK